MRTINALTGLLAAAVAALSAAASAAPPAQGWTTLGTRTTSNHAEQQLGTTQQQWKSYDRPALYPNIALDTQQYITMDDGVRLSADVASPADLRGNRPSQPLPVLLTLSGYSKDNGVLLHTDILGGYNPYLVRRGYIHVMVDIRGTGRSGGQWMAQDTREQQDYREVMDWVAAQPWCDGNIALYGASGLANTAALAANKGSPNLKALFLWAGPLGDVYRDVALPGGEGSVLFLTAWTAAVGVLGTFNTGIMLDPAQYWSTSVHHLHDVLTNFTIPYVLDRGWLGDPDVAYDGTFWASRSASEETANVHAPMIIVSGLHDIFQRSAPNYFDEIKHQANTKLIIGPWNHGEVALGFPLGTPTARALPRDGIPSYNPMALMWFDHYLKHLDTGAEALPNVTHWVWGTEHFVTESDWPSPAAHAQLMYLQPGKLLANAAPTVAAAPQSIPQDNWNGMCSEDTSAVLLGILGLIPLPCFEYDNNVQRHEAVYDTAAMTQDFYINGPIQANVFVSTTATNTGVVVRVDDVAPDGAAFHLTQGLLMASMRAVNTSKSRYLDGKMIQPWHPFTLASALPVGSNNVVLAQVEVWPTSALIRKGHKLRISVGPSDWIYKKSLPIALTTGTGTMSIYSDVHHPSNIVLPVMPAGSLK